MYGFLVRMVITFINYHFHFKYGTNQADLANIDPFMVNKKVEIKVFEKIKQVILTEELKEFSTIGVDTCCICMNEFNLGETVKILPCNSKHAFHYICIEKWLSKNTACPTCRKEVNME